MDDYKKTKIQLIRELTILRERIATIEHIGLARPPRVEFDAKIKIQNISDTIDAQGINLSKGGLCFELDEPLKFNVRFEFEEEVHNRQVELIWVRKFGDKYRCGLKFSD